MVIFFELYSDQSESLVVDMGHTVFQGFEMKDLVNDEFVDFNLVKTFSISFNLILQMPVKLKVPTKKRHPVKSVFGCLVCKIHLCKGQCFVQFHQELAQKVQAHAQQHRHICCKTFFFF